MNTKLTLRVDAQLIKKAKKYAAMHGVSVSEIVGNYFALLGKKVEQETHHALPMTRALRGVLKGVSVNEGEYKAHLEKKYK
ncbi:MAG TPA: DUF6364 family protein [Gammaproteobacteria bacterium]|nr:DUF6364 family protein [Gammaproteobacteria bacterium]